MKSDLLVPLVSEAGGAGATAALGDDGTGDGTGVGDSMAKTTAAARGKVSPGPGTKRQILGYLWNSIRSWDPHGPHTEQVSIQL